MSDTLQSLQRRQKSAGDLALVVRTMKAMAVSNITQYEMAVDSLQDYFRTISLGMYVSLKNEKWVLPSLSAGKGHDRKQVAIVFGSDQGLVGPFNDTIITFAKTALQSVPGDKEAWAIGERVFMGLKEEGLAPGRLFSVPNSVEGITPLVNSILMVVEEYQNRNEDYEFYIFHNSPLSGETYQQNQQRLYPPDLTWEQEINQLRWASKNIPQIIGEEEQTFRALIREYLFVSVYKACAESLASENASRLAAMQRAEKNIEEIIEELLQSYNRLRQSTIDEELFDVIAGFEALKKKE